MSSNRYPVEYLGQVVTGRGQTSVTFRPKFDEGEEPIPGDRIVAHVQGTESWVCPTKWTVNGSVTWKDIGPEDLPVEAAFQFLDAGRGKVDFYLHRGGADGPTSSGTTAR